jgi:carboxypeptidase Taq
MPDPLQDLKEHLAPIVDLRAAAAVLSWDQETYMPRGAIEARASQLGTLGKLAHELFVSDETGSLLEAAQRETEGAEYDSDEASLVRVTQRDYEKATRIPSDLVAELARETSRAQRAWEEARAGADFGRFQPHLERLLDLSVRKAEALGYEGHIYDALLDEYEPGMTKVEVESVFGRLRTALLPISKAIAAVDREQYPFLSADYPDSLQWDFGLGIMRDFGFDFERGRQDRSAHPFTTAFSIDDVRVTTRIHESFLPAGLFGSLHECGHALYEQGISATLERTPLADGASLGVHESQSRLWEILVGRSREFWAHYYEPLQAAFPQQLDGIDRERFYHAINKVEPSLIRVESDEVTYNLHIMMRFDLEIDLLEGTLDVADLPQAWNAKSEEYLGLVPADDAEGVLQDIHWSLAAFGYFPTYALGNLMSVQLFDAVTEEIGNLDTQIASGEFSELLGWLRDKIHRHGRKLTANELLLRACDSKLSPEPWLEHICRKYSDLMGLEL